MTARAAARERAWAAGAGPGTNDLVIDFDATLISTKADKQDLSLRGRSRWCWLWGRGEEFLHYKRLFVAVGVR